ncbi:MAG: hypothetical protein NC420_07580 [Eubacterium sp.]|nr:hypothetical protein [Eubacterium sp.]
MERTTLETAQRHLDAWSEAELAVTNAQKYGGRNQTYRAVPRDLLKICPNKVNET